MSVLNSKCVSRLRRESSMGAHCLQIDSRLTHNGCFSNYLFTIHLNIGLTVRTHSCRGVILGRYQHAKSEDNPDCHSSFTFQLSEGGRVCRTLPHRSSQLWSKPKGPPIFAYSLSIIGISSQRVLPSLPTVSTSLGFQACTTLPVCFHACLLLKSQ